MNNEPSDRPLFIKIDETTMVGLRFVSKFKLMGDTLQVTVPSIQGEITFSVHSDSQRIFRALKDLCA